jgi:methyl-accepting chemotaxis protein
MSIIDLEKSLSELHKELTRLLPAIPLAEKAIDTVEIAKAIPEKHQQLINELKTVFINPDELENEEFLNVYTRITNLLSELISVKEQIEEFIRDIVDLVEYLKNNDIPKKLEAVNFQLTGINNSLLTLQGQLNTIQSSINNISNTVDNIRQNSEVIITEIKNLENSTKQYFQNIDSKQNKHEKDLKMIKTILFVVCGLVITGTIAIILVLR